MRGEKIKIFNTFLYLAYRLPFLIVGCSDVVSVRETSVRSTFNCRTYIKKLERLPIYWVNTSENNNICCYFTTFGSGFVQLRLTIKDSCFNKSMIINVYLDVL